MNGFRTLLVALVVAGVTAGIATGGSNGSGKFALLGPDGNAFCDGSGVEAGDPGGFGFAVINAGGGTVQATVSLKGLAANATYHVFIFQGNADCDTEDGTITTNGKGNGNGHFSEPSLSSHALVFLFQDVPGGDSYVTDTYNH
jgi:hypothetical protein